jgi:hypothetical protein
MLVEIPISLSASITTVCLAPGSKGATIKSFSPTVRLALTNWAKFMAVLNKKI